MNYRQIKSLMVLHNVKSADIARKLGIGNEAVSLILTGRRRSFRVQTAIAEALHMPYEELWGPPHKPRISHKAA